MIQTRWFTEPKSDCHEALKRTVEHIRDRGAWRRDADEYHAELYGGGPGAMAVSGNTGYATQYKPATLPYNVVAQSVDTVLAKVATERPLPQAFTSQGDWSQQKGARKMSKAIEGEFHRQKIYQKWAPQIVRDAMVFDIGHLKVWREGKNIYCERLLPWEVLFDEYDAKYGDPRNIYIYRSIDREILQHMFPGHRDAIESAANSDGMRFNLDEDDSTVDRVYYCEAYHLAPGKNDDGTIVKGGRHAIIVNGATLLDEPYDKLFFPTCSLRYREPISGYRGAGMAELLEGYQYQINLLNDRIQEQHHLLGGAWIFTAIGSDVVSMSLTNGVNEVKHKPGMPPQVYHPDPVHPQTYAYLRDLRQDAISDAGVSHLAARSEKPSGVSSGRAFQVLDDVYTERFGPFVRAFQYWNVEVAEHIVDLIHEIAEDYGTYNVRAESKRGAYLDIDWAKDVNLERDAYTIKVFATSLLSKRPEAKLDQLEQWMNAKIITREQYMRLSNITDLESEADIETAPQTRVRDHVEWMLDADDPLAPDAYRHPDPYLDLAYAGKYVTAMLNHAWESKAPDETLNLLRRYISDVDLLKNGPMPEGPPAPSDMGPLPPEGASAMPPGPMPEDMGADMPPPPMAPAGM